MKLKTLKDIRLNVEHLSEDVVSVKELRQAAIEWIKDEELGCECDCQYYKWILKRLFNLTEEDLK